MAAAIHRRCGGGVKDIRAGPHPCRRAAARTVPSRDEQGSFGIGTDVWFLKLDASVDPMLADDFEIGGNPPRFLDRVNDPDRLRNYLDRPCRLPPCRRRRRSPQGTQFRHRRSGAADFAPPPVGLSLGLRGSRRSIRDFIAGWQDPATGFFGADYEIDGQRWRTADLSMTFHMARYLEGHIGHWPQLIDTLLQIRDDRYPNGWLDDEGITSHNNYDVAVLFSFGWPHMHPDQRGRARHELDRLLRWCLETAIPPDGTVVARAAGEVAARKLLFHDRLSRHSRLLRSRPSASGPTASFREAAGAARRPRTPSSRASPQSSDGADGARPAAPLSGGFVHARSVRIAREPRM